MAVGLRNAVEGIPCTAAEFPTEDKVTEKVVDSKFGEEVKISQFFNPDYFLDPQDLCPYNFGGGKSRIILQLVHRFPSSDCTLLRTRSRPQSDYSIPNKIQPQVPTKIQTPTLPLEANLMLIVPPVELCPG
ncbi:Uncharacterized protein Fot_08445 [Forsythia ovata]|uniref:Uncharacterized protein n=1 Tax=Forsythia ovata TaxID=205694 RepID=A0ABD1WZ16_9LAMI